MSRVVRKPAFCICENKAADQLRGNREAEQRLCFIGMLAVCDYIVGMLYEVISSRKAEVRRSQGVGIHK